MVPGILAPDVYLVCQKSVNMIHLFLSDKDVLELLRAGAHLDPKGGLSCEISCTEDATRDAVGRGAEGSWSLPFGSISIHT